ncbi:MAG: ROK family protein [Actinomycetota bacterium]|nr:ROK family protein [Actinomycetota bacterium]
MTADLPPAARAVAVEVLVHGQRSRAQLAKTMGLSPATLTRLVRPLVDAGVLVESGAVRTPGRGRSSLPLDVVVDASRFVGVKLTTDSIYAVVTDLRAEVIDSETLAEPSLAVPEVVAAVAGVVGRLVSRADRPVRAVGVTVGGKVHDGETVADSPFLHWHDVPFRTLLAHQIAAPLHLANDVVGLTKAQQWFGYGRTYADFALLTVGAGVGYGLVVNHEVVPTLVSPISHLPVDPYGPLCPLGHRGCLTAYVTSPAMTAAVSQAHGRSVTYDEVLRLTAVGDPVAGRVVREAARALGRTVGAITSLTGVERIILSGEGVGLVELARDALECGRSDYGVGAGPAPELVIQPMDFLEWARGAAVVAIQAVFLGDGFVTTSAVP